MWHDLYGSSIAIGEKKKKTEKLSKVPQVTWKSWSFPWSSSPKFAFHFAFQNSTNQTTHCILNDAGRRVKWSCLNWFICFNFRDDKLGKWSKKFICVFFLTSLLFFICKMQHCILIAQCWAMLIVQLWRYSHLNISIVSQGKHFRVTFSHLNRKSRARCCEREKDRAEHSSSSTFLFVDCV